LSKDVSNVTIQLFDFKSKSTTVQNRKPMAIGLMVVRPDPGHVRTDGRNAAGSREPSGEDEATHDD